jgi:predicted ribosome quality control (RQC) complex YloA/Tae2 family protein
VIRAQLGENPERFNEGDSDGQREARACRKLLKQTRARLERLSKALWSDLERADHAQRWLEEGELLKSQLTSLQRGMTEVTVTDWYDPDMRERVINLDPKLNGLENVERLFKRHRKALKGADIATDRLTVVEDQVSGLAEITERFSEGPLDELRVELVELGVYRVKQKKRTTQQQATRLPYRMFWSAQGEKIWLGRGGMDNHLTSFQAARGQDLWVHTRDVPGAHVIIPLSHRGHTPQFETVLDAAALAVHHSKQRGEEAVELYFTERKHIRPVPGGPPGKVMVASSKTITAEDVDLRITRLYAEAERREALKS